MKTIKSYIKYLVLAMSVMVTASCTKLDENIYSKLETGNFYNNKNEVLSAVLRPYTHANAWITPGQNGWWRISELSSDLLSWPQKGRHGYDDGKWIRDHYHTWIYDDEAVWEPWRLMWWGLGLCNDPIENLERREAAEMGITQEEKDAYIGEMKLLRAFHHMRLMDLWGNIPIVTVVGEKDPPTKPRTEVFNFIEKEILENMENLPNLSSNNIGRISKAAAYGMLVELYLNAEVWTGTARWDDCITYCNKLINNEAGGQSGAMALDPTITATYNNTNDKSKEIIFSIAYKFRDGIGWKPQWTGDFYHFNQRFIYGGEHDGNDGVVVNPGVWDQYYKNTDMRKESWFLHGRQTPYDPSKPVLGTEEYRGQPLEFVDNIRRNSEGSTRSDMTQGEENSGYRFNKYKPGASTDPNYMSNDWAIYRLTWVYFAKAEAIMRKNGGTANAEAVDLINTCKRRAFSAADWPAEAYTTSTLTINELFNERTREFFFEGWRRQDLIRFGRFLTAEWWDHKPSLQEHLKLMRVPDRQIQLNPNLKQNPGYN
ncbi:putative outer membrane starch-binding protein [Arcticibacter tournemirensis]|uniref:RagB/SusD family nutrient uptake outer membrane protein n=1 Tax=Arcticibacter tournemirensis TaxID=699437 RepID=A0A5M9GR18_9SPHI|nr:RagB/SusD family nutrient uptake outer membrane protein [Arcticibacter tournemirensis]KAA8477193.1 RagB/SusD family nutrient uptake outer membrane protein [Arcticibacter tournemirensis]TQM50189.1 putative outer membrane starch-binding protein [Arcticibacter tournemirensis]